MQRGPLTEVRVLDFTTAMAGPSCSMLLADFGADVVKVEPPTGDNSRKWGTARFGEHEEFSALFTALNRNKASVTIDLKSDDGQSAVRELLRKADVVLENFTPGVADRLGIGYGDAVALRPDVVYCSISGFGQTGPLAGHPGYDQLLQAYAGHMSITGEPGRPSVRIGPSAIDLLTGAHAAFGIVVALRERELSGRGQHLETSLYDTSLHLITHVIADYTGSGRVPKKVGGDFAFLAPYGMFQARDREFYMGVGNDRMFASLCDEIGRPDLVRDERYGENRNRVLNREELGRELAPILAGEDAAHWVERCARIEIPASLVCDVAEVVEQEQAAARGMIVDSGIDGVRTAGIPIKLAETPGAIRRPPPRLGEDNDSVIWPLERVPSPG